MKELICPNCHKAFKVSEEDYASIVSQVKSAEFEAELSRRIDSLHEQHKAQEQLVAARAEKDFREALNKKELELSAKETEIAQLKSRLSTVDDKKAAELQLAIAGKDQEIAQLKSAIKEGDARLKLAVMEEKNRAQQEVQNREMEIERLKSGVELEKQKAANEVNAVKETYEIQMDALKQQVEYYRDLKAKMSTKMVGETLEQHCSIEFEQYIRPFLPNATFGKDNDVKDGTKGDFIFRDKEDDVEYISIMFEMKNEMDETATKHKNEDFLKKLDEDRKKKGCEFAVLVSLLEADNELYNTGIVNKSHLYDKMYVIRPQFFVPFINLLVQASKKSLEYKKQLLLAQSKEVDVTNFESKIDDFRSKFSGHYEAASKKFNEAIKHIDETIAKLQKVREELLGSENKLRLANQDTEMLSIKRLTRGNPTMKAKFDEARKAAQDTEVVE